MKQPSSNKIVLKIFDRKVSTEKKLHTCSVCQVYKREIAKGNTEALEFYKQHINELVRKYHGATIVVEQYSRANALPLR